ncbi:MAG: hypothetical protein K6G88_12490 [Lachnospiraceae bacterium]|nr:hypothetical protein [Lachnospiraceae bacterium]
MKKDNLIKHICKLQMVLLLAFATVFANTGCEMKSSPAIKVQDVDTIRVGDIVVPEDEMRYYFYNTQATYEAYYIAEEMELDWNSEIQEGTTMSEGVKSTVLDDICRREVIAALAEEYEVKLDNEEFAEAKTMVETFFTETNPKLQEKIEISPLRLEEVFEKDILYKKVEKTIEDEEAGKADEVYKNWKTANNVTTGAEWDKLNFDETILAK